jgi:hypothetical protein
MSVPPEPSYGTTIELHDSTVAAFDVAGESLVIRLAPAIIHRSAGVGGVDSRTVWTQNAVMTIRGTKLLGNLPVVPIDVADGEVELGGRLYMNSVPLSPPFEGEARVKLVFENSSEVEIRGNQFTLDLEGDARFLEVFPE